MGRYDLWHTVLLPRHLNDAFVRIVVGLGNVMFERLKTMASGTWSWKLDPSDEYPSLL
jgi:hypothetical protein